MSSGTTTVRVVADITKFNAAMKRTVDALNQLDWTRLRRALDTYERQHPRPLCIDGHEYARRRRARR